jgi:UDP-N-acetylmuramate--alanine ligase
MKYAADEMRKLPLEIGTLHFIGIGGIGMSGIAEVLHNLGYRVQGSDMAENYNVARLKKMGIRVMIGHEESHILDADGFPVSTVIYSSAVKADNPEMVAASKGQIAIIKRAAMLAELMRLKWAIAIAGTHGKTTTTSMVGHVLTFADYDPTIINGGIINSFGTNAYLGRGDWMVVESDESDGTFKKLPFVACAVTNIDPEHMDHYGSFEEVKKSYVEFVQNLPFYGFAAVCSDHAVVKELIPEFERRVITYGLHEGAFVRALNVTPVPSGLQYDVQYGDDLLIKNVFLPMFGQHNILNSLAAFAIGHELGIALEDIKASLKSFSGVKRRFTQTGVAHGITVIDDYGHHPVEIEAVLRAGNDALDGQMKNNPNGARGRLIAVMQPHRYSRLAGLFDDFKRCFKRADAVVIADVYAAGETPLLGADKESLVRAIKAEGKEEVYALSSPEDLPRLISTLAKPNDLVICLGAGNITQWAYDLPKKLDALYGDVQKKA